MKDQDKTKEQLIQELVLMRHQAAQKEEDLTRLKQVEEALRTNEQRLALAIAGSDVGLYDLHIPSGEMHCNERWARTFGYTLAELKPLKWMTVKSWVHPDDLAVTDALLQQHLASGAQFFQSEVRLRHKDGHWVWVQSRGAVVERDANGHPLRMAGTHIDCTDRKRAEEALQKSKEQYRNIFENAVVGIFRSSPEGRFLTANPTAARLLGYESSEELVSSITDIPTQIYANPEDREEATRLMKEQGFIKDFKAQFRRKDGSVVWGSLSAKIVRDEKGQVLYYEGMSQDITERKLAEEQLRKTQQQLKLILDSVPAMIWQKDREGKYLQVNKAYCDAVGLIKEAILGKTDHDLFTGEIAANYTDYDSYIINSGKPVCGIEERHIKPSAEYGWSLTDKLPFRDDQGNVTGTIGFALDITARKQLEMAILEGEKNYRSIVENMNDAIYIHDFDGNIIDVNENACRMVGYERQELVGVHLSKIDHDWRLPSNSDLEVLLRDGLSVFERKNLRNDGSVVPVEVSVKIVSREGKGIIQGFVRNITDRKRAEEALRQSEERFRAFMDNSPTIAWIKDEEGRHVYLSKTYENYFGVRLEDWLGKTDFEVWPLEIAEDFRKNDMEVLRGIQSIQVIEETTGLGKGRCIWWNSKFPFQDASGKRYIGGIGLDITHRMLMEEELRKARDELELRVRERTVELERVNDQLRSIPSKLISAQEEDRKRIAGDLHDSIGQTLAALKYGIETVLLKKDHGDLSGAFKLLARFVPTLQRSIEDTRSIYMGLRPLMLDNLGLLATLDWFGREFQNVHANLHLDLEVSIEEEEIPDSLKITVFRIVQEALNNVAKHSGATRVEVSMVKNEDSIKLVIQDDGIGFDLSSDIGGKLGPGLGLTGMRERVEITAGQFSIDSAAGRGTILRAFWPMQVGR